MATANYTAIAPRGIMANFEARETQDGKTSYRVKIRLKGYPPQTATFGRLTDPKKWVAFLKTAEAKKHTLDELVDR
jgi:hypothetical protein